MHFRRLARTRFLSVLLVISTGGAVLPASLLGQARDTTGAPLPRILPVDEGARVPSFFAFRARLQRTIAERDVASLLTVVDSALKFSFGREAGIGAFEREWFESPERSIWPELGAALALGGRFMGDSLFYAPYTFNAFAPGERPPEYDPFEALIAIDDAVPVLAAPEPGADTLAVLSFHLVRHEWRSSVAEPPAGWTAIRLADGALGFVRTRSMRSPLDYRAVFERRDGSWRMTIFIAGD